LINIKRFFSIKLQNFYLISLKKNRYIIYYFKKNTLIINQKKSQRIILKIKTILKKNIFIKLKKKDLQLKIY